MKITAAVKPKSREQLYAQAVTRLRRTKNRAHPRRGKAGDRYYAWIDAWWEAIQRAFPGAA